jgi:hypothetical protein
MDRGRSEEENGLGPLGGFQVGYSWQFADGASTCCTADA